MNITPINTMLQKNITIKQNIQNVNRFNSKEYSQTNKSSTLPFKGGYYSTPRSCILTGIGFLLGAFASLVAAPVGIISSSLAFIGGGIVGGNAINYIPEKLCNKKQ